ncbi:hypothetical protein M0R88_02345 [Halorussus gelatinilyticus]|uniref:DUF7115 domain-containing protein n=1 Tax=Halorussus gelatinilyticus TaxID=2937524 RepID=A0A8U0IJX8_9EURY|nr:hypothetical protein [Halorussus gelatinilyticus]UPW00951.1 hypothetical protein M0R88_02345 [Halorussus gelatinilyticus]
MSVPGIVQSRLDGEQVAAQVALGGEDGLYVTRTRTLIYRADGLLSDESVEEYPHEAERIEISEGRRKSSISLDYGIDGEEKFKIPSNRLYEALHPVLAGVLNAADVTGPDETVKQTYQFSELTLVITSERVVKHVGAAVWDEDYEEFYFDDVTALDVEEGNVSSQIIIESEGRPQRIKTPSDQTREVRERIERALLDYHGMSSYDEFAREHADPEKQAETEKAAADDGDDAAESEADPLAGGGVDPIDANPPELDDDGAIIEDDASVTTADRPDEDVTAAEASEAAARAAEASAGTEAGAGAETSADAEPSAGVEAGAGAEQPDGPADADAGGETDAADQPTGATLAETDEAADTADASAAATVTDGEPADATAESAESSGFADSGFEPASSELERDTTEEQLAALTEAVERQNELLAEQQRTLQQLIEELSRGR